MALQKCCFCLSTSLAVFHLLVRWNSSTRKGEEKREPWKMTGIETIHTSWKAERYRWLLTTLNSGEGHLFLTGHQVNLNLQLEWRACAVVAYPHVKMQALCQIHTHRKNNGAFPKKMGGLNMRSVSVERKSQHSYNLRFGVQKIQVLGMGTESQFNRDKIVLLPPVHSFKL